jgi:hypothetical protein
MVSKRQRTKGIRKMRGGIPIAGDTRVAVEWADGETRYLKYTMRAIGTLENCYPQRDAEGKYTGSPATPIGEILKWSKPETGMAWSLLENFLWAGLLHEYPDLTKEDMDDWIEPSKIAYYDGKIGEALQLALGSKDFVVDTESSEGEGKKEQLTGTN